MLVLWSDGCIPAKNLRATCGLLLATATAIAWRYPGSIGPDSRARESFHALTMDLWGGGVTPKAWRGWGRLGV